MQEDMKVKTGFSPPFLSVSPDFFFLIFLPLLYTFKLHKFPIRNILLQQLFLLSLKHKPFLVESALISICRLRCFWSTADSAAKRGQPAAVAMARLGARALPAGFGLRDRSFGDGALKRRVCVPTCPTLPRQNCYNALDICDKSCCDCRSD